MFERTYQKDPPREKIIPIEKHICIEQLDMFPALPKQEERNLDEKSPRKSSKRKAKKVAARFHK